MEGNVQWIIGIDFLFLFSSFFLFLDNDNNRESTIIYNLME